MGSLVFDFETGPEPWERLERLFVPPEKPGAFDPATVKYGNTKDETKRREKLEEARTKHTERLAAWQAEFEQAKAEFIGKAALSPLTGQILAIGYYRLNDAGQVVCQIDCDDTEADRLERFWTIYKKYHANGGKLIGHNIARFDVPFAVRRSRFHRVDVPSSVFDGRYLSRTFVDTMTNWACGVYGDSVKLDDLARFFGVGGKPDGVSGADFARLFFGTPEERATAIKYLENDVAMTWGVAERLGLTA